MSNIENNEKEELTTNEMVDFLNIENIDGMNILSLFTAIEDVYNEKNVQLDEKTKECSSPLIENLSQSIIQISQACYDLINSEEIYEKITMQQLYLEEIINFKRLIKNTEFILGMLHSKTLSLLNKKELENKYFVSRVGTYLKNIPGNKFVSNGDIVNECLKRDIYVQGEYIIIELEKLNGVIKETKSFVSSIYYLLDKKK